MNSGPLTTPQHEALTGVLRKYWGYETFRPLQAEAMGCVLSNRDSVVVLPTGGGKSLCFQAPALLDDGLAVVVSPLISLMKDQVDALTSNGVPAACINSTLSYQERRDVADQIRGGQLRLLYAAPERLVQSKTIEFLQTANVKLIAIDEAHCISQWGHDFRPEYRAMRNVKEAFPGVGVHAYTATATERVRGDIARNLGLKDPTFLIGSFDRPNLFYRVERRANRLEQICEVIDRHAGDSGIVYCISRRDVDGVSEDLKEMGYKALPYHAGMSAEDRMQNQESFIEERTDIIVATVAFGMGIDKPNVRFVVHAGMPKSLEAYQQESGRAGRDGLEAECCLFYSAGDSRLWRTIIEDESTEARKGAIQSLESMDKYGTGIVCRHRALVNYFGQDYDGECGVQCDICAGERELMDGALVIAQKILSSVVRQGQRFGGDYTSQVLTGSKDQRILQNGHDSLSTYGLLSDFSKRIVRDWIEQLVGQGFMKKVGEYNVLTISSSGRRLLKGDGEPKLLKPADAQTKKAATKAAEADSWEGVDRGLFDHLRELRSEIAEDRGVPAYVVFGDATLRDMARRRPSTLDTFRRIRGVGDKKLEDFGDTFVAAISEYCDENEVEMDVEPGAAPAKTPAPPKRNPSTRTAAELFDQGMSVDDVAEQMGRANSTVVSYLRKYLEEKCITDPSPWASQETIQTVHAALAELGSGKLKPLYEHLGGEIEYDDLAVIAACWRNAGMNLAEDEDTE